MTELPEGWQPIETAPKDGTHVLICDASKEFTDWWTFNQKPPVVAHYWSAPGEEGFYLSSGATEEDKALLFTHWMPLPPPPTKESPDA